MKINTLLKCSFLLIFNQLFAQYSTQTTTTSTTKKGQQTAIVIVDGNGLIKIYNSSSLSLVNSLQAHSNAISRIKISPFNTNSTTNYVATCSKDKTVKTWKVTSSFHVTLIRTYSQHSSDVYALEWLDNDTLASGSYDKTIKIWSMATGQTKRTIQTNQYVFSLKLLNIILTFIWLLVFFQI